MKNIRLSIDYIRALPFIGTAFSVLHMALLLFAGDKGYDNRPDYVNTEMYIVSFAVEKIWSLFLLVGFLIVSKSFGFCRLHRFAIIYLFVAYSCYDYQRLIGFGNFLFIVRTILLVGGIFILIRFFVCRCCDDKEKDEA